MSGSCKYGNESSGSINGVEFIGQLSSYGKVNISLCLDKYDTMKTYPVLNKAPRHEDVWGNGGIAPLLLDLRSRWR
jgi:hypothetical protein